MKKRSQMLAFLLLNIVVSATTTWVVIRYWEKNNMDSTSLLVPAGAVEAVETAEVEDASPAIVTDGNFEIETVVGAGDLNNEHVKIVYQGDEEVSLAGWVLQDADGNQFVFPGLTMFGNGAITVATRVGNNSAVEIYWGLDFSVWESGDTVSLYDSAGGLQAELDIP